MKPLAQANLRIDLLSELLSDVPARLRSRRMPSALRDLEMSTEQLVRFALHDQRETFSLVTAAVLNANDLALLIDAEARQLIDKLINRQTRMIALELRQFSRPANALDAEGCLAAIEADQALCMAHWFDAVPAAFRTERFGDLPQSDDPYLTPALTQVLLGAVANDG